MAEDKGKTSAPATTGDPAAPAPPSPPPPPPPAPTPAKKDPWDVDEAPAATPRVTSQFRVAGEGTRPFKVVEQPEKGKVWLDGVQVAVGDTVHLTVEQYRRMKGFVVAVS